MHFKNTAANNTIIQEIVLRDKSFQIKIVYRIQIEKRVK